MIVVFDANLFLSAFISKKGIPNQLIRHFWMGQRIFDVAISKEIVSEIKRVLHYPKFKKYAQFTDDQIERYISAIVHLGVMVTPTQTLSISTDESDNRYIECAVEAKARYIATGDKKHLLPIKEYQGIEIITPRTFVNLLQIDFGSKKDL